MNKVNYQRECDKVIDRIIETSSVPTLLLHSCCAPCSSYVLSYLAQFFRITVYYYNPNITEKEEYEKRVKEQRRLIDELPAEHEISFVEGPYEPEKFLKMAEGLEGEKEGGARCFLCYELRLRQAIDYAKANGFAYVTTTLSVSPHKNADKLNEIGLKLAGEADIDYLLSDFKKKGGYLKSIELSKKYDLYRQNYCGCIYSKACRMAEKEG